MEVGTRLLTSDLLDYPAGWARWSGESGNLGLYGICAITLKPVNTEIAKIPDVADSVYNFKDTSSGTSGARGIEISHWELGGEIRLSRERLTASEILGCPCGGTLRPGGSQNRGLERTPI